ncbi:MAG: FG-GAP repeat protein, partial [Pseudomonadales bacterium]|nr:FG-GAP repeat protein [Pseudomonadales bacterium]
MTKHINLTHCYRTVIDTAFFIAFLTTVCLTSISSLAQFNTFVEVDDDTRFFSSLPDTRGNDSDLGNAIAGIGDIDGDGTPDIILTAWKGDVNMNSNTILSSTEQKGVIWVAFLRPDGSIKAYQEIGNGVGGFPSGILENNGGFGGQVGTIGDLDGDGITDVAVSARHENSDDGAIYILFLNANGTVKEYTKIGVDSGWSGTSPLSSGTYFGALSVSPLGDFDGDGVLDLLAGARDDNDGGTKRGALWILFLNTDGTVKDYRKISDTQGGFTAGLDDGDGFGSEMDIVGDLDGNGVVDIAVRAQSDDDDALNSGAIWILFLSESGTVNSYQKINATQGGFTATLGNYSGFGLTIVGLGDLDNDSVNDIAVGADAYDVDGLNRGAFWILYLNANGTVKAQERVSSATAGFTNVLGNHDNFANDGANVGDINGDGIVDLLIAADSDDYDYLTPSTHGRAASYLFFLSELGASGNQAPALSPIGNQNVTESQLLTVALSATDADGPAPLTLTETNDLPGTPNILTDSGNGTGSLDWTPSLGDAAGSPYSVTVTATDGNGAFTSETFSIVVSAQGAGGTLSGSNAATSS